MRTLYAKAPAGALVALGLALLCAVSQVHDARAALFGIPNGATNPNGWFVLTGGASANADGDTVHSMTFKIEVTGTSLAIQIFDAGNSGARDLVRTGTTNTTYTLRDPSGAIVNTAAIGGDFGATDNTLVNFPGSPFAVQPGLYEFQVSMSGGRDVNAFGLNIPNYEVYTSTDIPAGAEAGHLITGGHNGGTPNANITQPIIAYAYVDRGCDINVHNYDMDVFTGPGLGGSGSITSRLGVANALTMSGSTVAVNDNIAPIVQATQAQDYGLWRLDNNMGSQQNIIDWRAGDWNGVVLPGANLPFNSVAPIRIFLPADGSVPGTPVTPLEPRVEQTLTPLSQSGSSTPGGPNPPVAGAPRLYLVTVAHTTPPATGDTTVTLTANVPGVEVLYDCSTAPITACAQVSGGGSISSEPADGGSGDVVATWASVAAGATVNLTYFIAVTPAGAGVVNVTATPASGNGTRVVYTPASSSVTFPRTDTMGPLCELMVQASTAVPNAVALSRLEARAYAGEVWLEWETASEWANLGFNVYRAEGTTARFVQVNADLILGAGTSTLQADYLFIDPTAEDGRLYTYLIEDVERTGKRTLHGPVSVRAGSLAPASRDGRAFDRVATPGGEISVVVLAAIASAPSTGSAISVAAALPPAPAPEIEVAAKADKIWKILSEDETGMLIELRSERPVLAPVVRDGVSYTDVSIPGFSQVAEPGKPALPVVGVPIEIPAVADVTVSAQIHRSRSAGVGILPAPAPALTLAPDGSVGSTYAPNPAIYGGSAAYPASPVATGGSVRQGGKKLVVLVLKPVAWSPGSGVLTHARRVRVRIDYHGAQTADLAASPGARLENQFFLASRGALKIAVAETGIQAVSGQALLDAGLDPATDPRTLALYREGRELAVLFQGEEDGVLDPGDRLLFYGQNRNDDHALARTYWLSGGNLSGLRMAAVDAAPTGAESGEMRTPASVTREKNLVYLPFVLNGEASNFVGDSIFLNPRDQVLNLAGVSGEPATLHVRLQGATTDSNVNPDHHMLLSVNGVEVGHARWDAFEAFEDSVDVPAGVLAEGDNVVRITPVDDTGAVFDFVYIDRVELRYERALGSAGASFALRTIAPGDRTLEGIAGDNPVLLDITDPDAPLLLEGATFAPGGTLTFGVSGGEHRIVMATDLGVIIPEAIERDQPSALNAAPGTDWLAIAHEDFVAGTAPLADLREGEGLRTAIASVQDVYDEFSFGDPDPQAIRDYLAWQYDHGGEPRLRYVLLVGDASHDERDYLGQPNRNFVPTKLLDGTFTERASDNWFASFLGNDALPDVALGRLPVSSPGQLADVVAKISGYAGQPLGEDWQQRSLLVSDDGFRAFHAGEGAIFEAISDAMASQLPPRFDPLKLYLSDIPEAEQAAVARQSILDVLNAGALTASYAGHGAITLWADEVIFKAADLADLDNADSLPFVIVLNCLNGFFGAPLGDSLGESMLLMPAGGAVAFFAPTGVSPIGGQDIFGEAISRALFREGYRRIGDALVRAREATLGLPFFDDLSGSWVLLGDPATTLAFAAAPIADAGEDLETKAKTKVALSGHVSGGVAGSAAYAWRLVSAPAGSNPALLKADRARAALRVDAPGDYVVSLIVTVNGKPSAPDTVRVRVLPRHPNTKGGDDTL
ncbi:MAG: C25 family cysteine peptidase [Myxococcota bacterium]